MKAISSEMAFFLSCQIHFEQFIPQIRQLSQKEFQERQLCWIFAHVKTNKSNVMKAILNNQGADSIRNNYFSNFKDCKRIQWSNHRNYGY